MTLGGSLQAQEYPVFPVSAEYQGFPELQGFPEYQESRDCPVCQESPAAKESAPALYRRRAQAPGYKQRRSVVRQTVRV